MRIPRWLPVLGRILPPGFAELCLAGYVLAAWLNISLFGPRTAFDVMFLVGAEAGLLLLGGGLGILASSRPTRDGLILVAHLVLWSVLFGRWVFVTAGWFALVLVIAHLFVVFLEALRNEATGGEVYRRHYVVPVAVLTCAVLLASFCPLPYLAWSYYSVPPEARIYLEGAHRGIPNWFPAVGVFYFGGLAAVRLGSWRRLDTRAG